VPPKVESRGLTFTLRVLSSSTLAALEDFYTERDEHARRFADLKAQAEESASAREQGPLSMDAFTEDWNESQFWVSKSPSVLCIIVALVLERITTKSILENTALTCFSFAVLR